jgi:hypothetical protein
LGAFLDPRGARHASSTTQALTRWQMTQQPGLGGTGGSVAGSVDEGALVAEV